MKKLLQINLSLRLVMRTVIQYQYVLKGHLVQANVLLKQSDMEEEAEDIGSRLGSTLNRGGGQNSKSKETLVN